MRTEAAPARAVPAELPRFETLRTLGAGGRVRLVQDLRHGGAVRVLKSARALDLEDASDVLPGGDVLREARALAALRHPGVPRLYEVGVFPDGLPWLLSEYVKPAGRDAPHVTAGGVAP